MNFSLCGNTYILPLAYVLILITLILFSSIKQTAESNILVYYIPENLIILTG